MPTQKVSNHDIIKISFGDEDCSLSDLIDKGNKNKSKTKIEFLSSEDKEFEEKLQEEERQN